MAPLILLAIGLAAIFLFRWADRKVGSDDPRPKSTGYGAVFLFGLLCHGLNYVAALPSLWLVAVLSHVWILYRSLPWKVGGSTTPRSSPEIIAALVRHSLPLLAYGGLVIAKTDKLEFDLGNSLAMSVLASFAVVSTFAQVRYAHLVDSGRPINEDAENARVESTRGAMFGVCLAMVALFA